MPKPKVKLPTGQTVRWEEREFPSVYANIMGFGMSPFDINFMFGEIKDATPEEVIGIPRVKLILSPEQAANLMKLLGIALQTFAQTNGKLRTAGALDVAGILEQLKGQTSTQAEEDEG